jgi:hypothetical protein
MPTSAPITTGDVSWLPVRCTSARAKLNRVVTDKMASTWGKIDPKDVAKIILTPEDENPVLPKDLIALAVFALWVDPKDPEIIHSELLPVVMPTDLRNNVKAGMILATMQMQAKRGITGINSIIKSQQEIDQIEADAKKARKQMADVDLLQRKLPFEEDKDG